MKKQILLITIALLSFITFNSCTNESTSNEENSIIKSSIVNFDLKSEAENLVDLHCKAISVLRKIDKGDRNALNRSNAYRKEADKISRDLEKKYSSPDEQAEFSKAYQEALVNCPSFRL